VNDTIRQVSLKKTYDAPMFRTAFFCFFLGLFVVVVAWAFFVASDEGQSSDAGQLWRSSDMRVLRGLPLQANGALAVQLDTSGQAIIEVRGGSASLRRQPLLHLQFRESPNVLGMVVTWRTDANRGRPL